MNALPGSVIEDVTDVLIVGRGVAGLTCALEAHLLGLDVIVAERGADVMSGGNSPISAQGFAVPSDPVGMATYLSSISDSSPTTFREWCEAAAATPSWLAAVGGSVLQLDVNQDADFPDIEGATSFHKYVVQSPGASGLFRVLSRAVERRGSIRNHFDCRVVQLSTVGGAVVGAVAIDRHGRERYFTVRHGVVIASGGYAMSLAREWGVATDGSPMQDGDGARLARSVGAAFSSEREYVGLYLSFRVPGTLFGIPLEPLRRQSASEGSFIVVDMYGERVADELAELRHGFERRSGKWERRSYPKQLWLIGDRKVLDSGPLHRRRHQRVGSQWNHDEEWSNDSVQEVARGWIHVSSDLGTLSERIGLPADKLSRTVEEWNESCRSGVDSRWQRSEKLVQLDEGPFFAVELVPSILNTLDGPQVDFGGRVVNEDLQVVRGLYAIGEASSPFRRRYQGATNLADCVVSGRTAAQTLARQWKTKG